MEPARALADLLAASPGVEAATVFSRDDEPLAAVGLRDSSASAAARAGRTLLEDARGSRGVGEPVQLHAQLAGGDVFVVGRQGEPAILAVTTAGQAPGLVFHDLKRCLASIDEVAA